MMELLCVEMQLLFFSKQEQRCFIQEKNQRTFLKHINLVLQSIDARAIKRVPEKRWML